MEPNPSNNAGDPEFSVARSVKIGSFHIGSSMSDLLTSAIWNRVMITDLGLIAWPVALLSALRYLLAPLSLWAEDIVRTRIQSWEAAGWPTYGWAGS